jgi:hypothetical protein
MKIQAAIPIVDEIVEIAAVPSNAKKSSAL